MRHNRKEKNRMKANSRVPKIRDSKKKPVFSKETFLAIHNDVTPKIGHDAGAVEVVSTFFTAKGVADLYSGVSATDVTGNLEAILASIKPVEEENDGGNDIHNYLDAAADEEFRKGDGSRWNNQFKVKDLLGFLKAKKYGPKNPASPEVINGFIAANKARDDKAAEFRAETPEVGVPASPCDAGRHKGPNPATQPGQRYLVRWDKHEPVGVLTHTDGGEKIVVGDFLFKKDEAFKLISTTSPDKLKGADLLVLAADMYRHYCPACQYAAKEALAYGERIDFKTLADIEGSLERMRTKVLGVARASEEEAAATRKPRDRDGSRPGSRKTDRWARTAQ